MKHVSIALALVGSALFSACGGGEEEGPAKGNTGITDPVQMCTEVVKTECARIYECFTPQVRQLAGLPATEAECNSQGRERVGCASATADKICVGDKPLPVSQGDMCVGQAKAASCTQITNNGTNIAAYAPACGQCVPL